MKNFWLYIFIVLFIVSCQQKADNSKNNSSGSDLWFIHPELSSINIESVPTSIYIKGNSETFSVITEELKNTLGKLSQSAVTLSGELTEHCLAIATKDTKEIAVLFHSEELRNLGQDGFIIRSFPAKKTIIIGNTDKALLYGAFHYLRLLQTAENFKEPLDITEIPSYDIRILNHWDNLDGTVERGYAGRSIWKWDELPEKISPRYKAYAKANASIGINGTVLNNVNANPDILKTEYLKKAKVLADIFRPYGIKVYLSINFSSPHELGGLANSDPLNQDVQNWWKEKVKEIYSIIPDFGGFLVKANSEGLPGPQDFGRTHADGANMLADALRPFGGIVMWRAFVYNPNGNDRAKQSYDEFMPLDGKFRSNVILQVKNGPVDFQPREPFSPLFGQMQHTTIMPELQITKEYLGFSDHVSYLGTLFQEFLNTDTYTHGRNTTIARITDGSIFNDSITGIAGVANIGEDTNWCGHHFAQANWYVFGRLAWNNTQSVREIAKEWIKQTFTHDTVFVSAITRVMMESRESVVNYMTPLGLHHLMGWGHHYGPEPWCEVEGARPDWLPTYYHKADSIGLGFDRSTTGSNAVAQYSEPLKSIYDDPRLCPEEYLLWFHHLPWNYELTDGKDLWTELCYRYNLGVEQVVEYQKIWESMKSKIDKYRFEEVQKKLATQVREAIWWRDACTLYFQTFSNRPIPEEFFKPVHKLEDLKELKFDLKHHN